MRTTYRNSGFIKWKKEKNIQEFECYYSPKESNNRLNYPTVLSFNKDIKVISVYDLSNDINIQFVHDFKIDADNEYYCDIEGVIFTKDKKKLVAFPPGRIDDKYVIPQGTEVIGANAFTDSYVTEIDVPQSVNVLEKQAFYASYSYIIDFSDCSIKKIGSGCFKECDIYVLRANKFPRENIFAQNWRGTRFIYPDVKNKLLELIFSGKFHEIHYWDRYN